MSPAHASPSRPPRSRFEQLYREHAPFVWAAARQCAPAAAVDDVVQDVFVTAYRRLDDLRWEVSARGWLYGVTRRVAFRYRRTAARTARRAAAVAVTSRAGDDPRPGLDASRQVRALLEQLPARQRELVVMSELLGMSGPEIAAELGVPLDTAYSRVRAVRRRLASLARDAETLDRALAGERAEAKPSERQLQRGWAALVPLVRAPWGAAGAGAGASGGVTGMLPTLGIAAALVVTLGVVGVVARNAATEEGTRRASVRAGVDAPKDVRAPPSEPAGFGEAGAVPAALPEAGRRVLPPQPPVPAAEPATAHAPEPATAHTPEPAPRARPRAEAPADLEVELALLERARKALAADRPAEALGLLDRHARRFPRSTLADARQATRARALCQHGDPAAARAVAERLRAEHPGSAIAASLANVCDTDESGRDR